MRNRMEEAWGGALFAVIVACIGICLFPAAACGESICARVKIEIRQELTLERQAFDAHMRINNGLTDRSLEDVKIEISFADEQQNPVTASTDPDDTTACFFIRPDSEGLAQAGEGTWQIDPVAPGHAPNLHWLIIPAPGASGGEPEGKLYHVGAKLTYTLSGKEYVTEVTPDYIFVKPLPQIAFDYFLTKDVYGDDAFTDAIEAPVPFTLGVRAVNTGAGVAKNVKIDSAQPEIVENEQGLLIGFSIKGARVNGEPAEKSLLASLGDITPGEAAVGRWLMSCTLSGTFTDFSASVSHADELGGELTSLIRQEDIRTHFLLKDVRVDLPGRDGVDDFLAEDSGVLRVFESSCVDSPVEDRSQEAGIELTDQSGGRSRHRVTTPEGPGFVYLALPDPYAGQKVLAGAIRSDGKIIKPCNAWLSKTRKEVAEAGWNYWISLFDANTTGSYTLVFEEPAAGSNPPVLQYISEKTGVEGEQLSFLVEAYDPDGVTPEITVSGLPAGASLEAEGEGAAVFDWTPVEGQAGIYFLVFTASDGEKEASQDVTVVIHSKNDTDGDGMDDDWEQTYFGGLERDGTGDYDGDGITDLQEFLAGSDPTRPDHAPSTPLLSEPADGAETGTLSPAFTIVNSTDPDGDALFYDFELYEDAACRSMIAQGVHVTSGQTHTSWQPGSGSGKLVENARYYWRVRAFDGTAYSLWRYGDFLVNTANEPPLSPVISAPGDGMEAAVPTPRLEVTNSMDPDGDDPTYSFLIGTDPGLSAPLAEVSGIPGQSGGITGWTPNVVLEDGSTYYWRAAATDEHGEAAASQTAAFTVNLLNHPPRPPEVESPSLEAVVRADELTLIVRNAYDPDGEPLFYFFEADVEKTFHTSAIRRSPEIAEGLETTAWHVTDLSDDTLYHWRAKASDGRSESPWVRGSFFVNTRNNQPDFPTMKNPGAGAWTPGRTPQLIVFEAADSDMDEISYTFEVFRDKPIGSPVFHYTSTSPVWAPPQEFANNTLYYWRVLAADELGQSPGWTEATPFFVRHTNRPPTITGIPATAVDQGEMYSFTPIVHDPDKGDAMTFRISNKPGWAEFDPETGTLSGTPHNEDVGTTEGIVITVTDACGESSDLASFPITVVNVNDAPDAVQDTYETPRHIPLVVDAPGVLANDADPDPGDDLLSARLITGPLNGALFLDDDGSFIYIPEEGFVGTDQFGYAAADGAAASDPAAVLLEVVDAGGGPGISGIDDVTLSEENPTAALSILINSGDAGAGPFTVYAVSNNPDLLPLENIGITGTGTQRLVTISSEGDRHGTALLSIVVEDAAGASNAVSFTVTVPPPEAALPHIYFLLLEE